MARNDPFAGAKLCEEVGLDQRLFQSPTPSKEPSTERPTDRPVDRKVVPPVDRKKGRSTGTRTGRPADPSVARPTVQSEPERVVEHRAYDFFQDQVRWLNRRKLEFEVAYGKQVPATRMVQLAVDLLVADFESNGEDSQVVRVLIGGEATTVRPVDRPDGGVESPTKADARG